MASRRKSREFALQMLFQREVGDQNPNHVISTFFAGRSDDPEVERFARSLFEGTVDELAAIDQLIREQSQNWRVERMSAVDRNLLRLSVFELLRQTETPPAVIIDEALEIARKFSGESSVEFVNGILDGVRKKLSSNALPAELPQSAKTSPQK